MSTEGNRAAPDGGEGPPGESVSFGDTINWNGALTEVLLYVELPFWLMMDPGSIDVSAEGTNFVLDVFSSQIEVFANEVLDSRLSVVWRGPEPIEAWEPSPNLQRQFAELDYEPVLLTRPCKTVLRIRTHGLADAFPSAPQGATPRVEAEREAYWATLCEAHVPIINELIQRYRLATYDHHAFEVSARDVPIWYVGSGQTSRTVVLAPSVRWDRRPMEIFPAPTPGGQGYSRRFTFTDVELLGAVDASMAIPGEFDLMDARALMERGDYSGAVRRATTAIEAVLGWRLRVELFKTFPVAEIERRLKASENDVPGRLRQLAKLLGEGAISDVLLREFEATREIRHGIVHRGERVTFKDRATAQRCVDTSRWLFNVIENKPERRDVREKGGALKSVGRVALSLRFVAEVSQSGIVVSSGWPEGPSPS